jgi:hypothetical protein
VQPRSEVRISQRKKLVLIGYLKIVLKVLAILRCDESGRDDGDAKTNDRYQVLDRELPSHGVLMQRRTMNTSPIHVEASMFLMSKQSRRSWRVSLISLRLTLQQRWKRDPSCLFDVPDYSGFTFVCTANNSTISAISQFVCRVGFPIVNYHI